MGAPRYGTAEYRAELRRKAKALTQPRGKRGRARAAPTQPRYAKTVRLRSGGYVRLECSFDPAVLSGDDRVIVNVLTTMMDAYWFAAKATR